MGASEKSMRTLRWAFLVACIGGCAQGTARDDIVGPHVDTGDTDGEPDSGPAPRMPEDAGPRPDTLDATLDLDARALDAADVRDAEAEADAAEAEADASRDATLDAARDD